MVQRIIAPRLPHQRTTFAGRDREDKRREPEGKPRGASQCIFVLEADDTGLPPSVAPCTG